MALCEVRSRNVLVGAGDVAQEVARSPGTRAARVRSSAPHTNKDVVSAENYKKINIKNSLSLSLSSLTLSKKKNWGNFAEIYLLAIESIKKILFCEISIL